MLKAQSPTVRLVERLTERCSGRGAYSSAFRAALDSGGAWSAEARWLVAMAAEHHVVLDEQLLTLSDVRDLQRYRLELTRPLRAGTRIQ